MISGRAAKWIPPAVIGAAAIVMACWTWGTWPDVLVDYGWDLYSAWQLTQGKLLYRDLAWLYGPLSPYVNATLFNTFGVGIRTLVISNLVLVAVLIGLLWRIINDIGTRLSATVSALLFVTLFAFGQYAEIGNYNFVTPYSQALTHGVILGFAALVCFSSFLKSNRAVFILAAGVAAGLTILTKPETSLAAVTALSLGFAGAIWTGVISRGRRVRSLALLLAGLLLPLSVSILLFSSQEPLWHSVGDTFGAWRFVLSGTLSSELFFRRLSGFDAPLTNALKLLPPTAVYLIVFGTAAAAALRVRRWSSPDLFAIPFAAALGILSWSTRVLPWHRAAQPFSPILVVLLATLGLRVARGSTSDQAADRRLVMRFTMVVFASLLLSRMILNPIFYHYGFVLAMPATLVVVVLLLDWVPSVLARRGGAAIVFQAISIAAICVLVGTHLMAMSGLLRAKTERVGTGPDRFLADSRGKYVRDLLVDIEGRLQRNQTLVGLPDGAMLNYLSRRENPTPFFSFIPVLLTLFDEPTIVAALDRHRPDFVVILHDDTSEVGGRFLGRDYGRLLMAWVGTHYREVRQFGARPNVDDQFGILLMQRDDAR